MSLIQSHELPSARLEYDGYIIAVTFQNDMDEEQARNNIEEDHQRSSCMCIDPTQSYRNCRLMPERSLLDKSTRTSQ